MTEAWHDRDLQNPHQVEDKAQRVRAMFSAIAPSYDLNNRLHSLWRDQAWRRAAVKFAQLQPSNRVLDVACGTGDLAMAFCHALQPADRARVLGVDFTFDMLTIAQQKRGGLPVEYQQGDAMRLPVSDSVVDVVSIAFGIRNVADPARAIREFRRVLRPGGRVIILEFSLPTSRLMRSLYMFYFNHIMPRTAALIARDRSGAYKYLPRSVSTFIDRDQMVKLLTDAGFCDVTVRPLTLGIAVLYRGVRT